MCSLCAIDAQVTILQIFVTSIAKCGSRAKIQYEVTLFFPYQKLARSFCPQSNLQTQRNRLGHSKSYHPPRALVKLLSSIANVNTGREFQIRDHITLQARQYCNGACAMPEELQASPDYAVATEDCTWMVMITKPVASRFAPTVEFTSSSLCLFRAPGAWVSARTLRWWKTDGHFMQVNLAYHFQTRYSSILYQNWQTMKIKLADSHQHYLEVLSRGLNGKTGQLQLTGGLHNSYGLTRGLDLCIHISKRQVGLLYAVLKLISYSFYCCLIMFCRHITSY